MDYSPPSSSVNGILQARIPEWVAMVPLQRGLPDRGIEPTSPMSPALAGRLFTTNTTWEAHFFSYIVRISIGRFATNGNLLALILNKASMMYKIEIISL